MFITINFFAGDALRCYECIHYTTTGSVVTSVLSALPASQNGCEGPNVLPSYEKDCPSGSNRCLTSSSTAEGITFFILLLQVISLPIKQVVAVSIV